MRAATSQTPRAIRKTGQTTSHVTFWSTLRLASRNSTPTMTSKPPQKTLGLRFHMVLSRRAAEYQPDAERDEHGGPEDAGLEPPQHPEVAQEEVHAHDDQDRGPEQPVLFPARLLDEVRAGDGGLHRELIEEVGARHALQVIPGHLQEALLELL